MHILFYIAFLVAITLSGYTVLSAIFEYLSHTGPDDFLVFEQALSTILVQGGISFVLSIILLIIAIMLHKESKKEPAIRLEVILENHPEIYDILENNKKETIVLNPQQTKQPISYKSSKMGGAPNLQHFKNWPLCTECESPLLFVLQLYKTDFPTFYYPKNTNIFQLFRCSNYKCPQAYDEDCDLKMYSYFFQIDTNNNNPDITQPNIVGEDMANYVPDCNFCIVPQTDYPNYDDYPEKDYDKLNSLIVGDPAEDQFYDEFTAKGRTKISGYPSWTQSPNWPTCQCGQTKEFIFQLSSEDTVKEKPKQWSDHGIMIGDCGNIYFFVCRDCGQDSLETNWDCY